MHGIDFGRVVQGCMNHCAIDESLTPEHLCAPSATYFDGGCVSCRIKSTNLRMSRQSLRLKPHKPPIYSVIFLVHAAVYDRLLFRSFDLCTDGMDVLKGCRKSTRCFATSFAKIRILKNSNIQSIIFLVYSAVCDRLLFPWLDLRVLNGLSKKHIFLCNFLCTLPNPKTPINRVLSFLYTRPYAIGYSVVCDRLLFQSLASICSFGRMRSSALRSSRR
ncbi:hypothetical protein V8C43DRAFT_268389 [Trichoderma afarasin]